MQFQKEEKQLRNLMLNKKFYLWKFKKFCDLEMKKIIQPSYVRYKFICNKVYLVEAIKKGTLRNKEITTSVRLVLLGK
jgi:hypothetical protein